jgi:SAM-dependent methyltransferase
MKRSRSYALEDARDRAGEARRLELQAQIGFDFEKPQLIAHGLPSQGTMLDLGAGQGSFLKLIAKEFPGLRCVAVDRNPALLELARANVTSVAQCDLADAQALSKLLEAERPDAVLLRFVLQHMSAAERASLLGTLAASPVRVIVADADADSSAFDPPSPLLSEAMNAVRELQERLGGDRRIGAKAEGLLRSAGFGRIVASRATIDSAQTGFARWWEAFGPVVCAGLLSRPAVREAVWEWGCDAGTAAHWRAKFDVVYASGIRNAEGISSTP